MRFICWELIIFFLGLCSIIQAEVLIDFRTSPDPSDYFASSNSEITTLNGQTGIRCNSISNILDCHVGIEFTPNKFFQYGQKIRLTVYNAQTGIELQYNPAISFEDPDYPDAGTFGYWFAFGTRYNHQQTSQITVDYHIVDEEHKLWSGFPSSEGSHPLINICLRHTSSNLLLQMIELVDGDTIPPNPVTGLSASNITTTTAQISWNAATDNVEVWLYKIYVDGLFFKAWGNTSYKLPYLKPGTQHEIVVTAIDIRKNESHGDTINVTTTAWPYGDTLFDPWDLNYIGSFLPPSNSGGASQWSYAAGSMTYDSLGDPGNTDSIPGSIFAHGLRTNNGFYAEMSVPEPVISPTKNTNDLPRATTLTEFTQASPNTELTYAGQAIYGISVIQYPNLDRKLAFSWFNNYYFDNDAYKFSLSDLDFSNKYGPYKDPVGVPHVNSGNFVANIPLALRFGTLDTNFALTGAYRYGAYPAGPSIMAWAPLDPSDNQPWDNLSRITARQIIEYDMQTSADNTYLYDHIDGYHRGDGYNNVHVIKKSLVFVVTKGLGRFWYGYSNHQGIEISDYESQNIPPETLVEISSKGNASSAKQTYIIAYKWSDVLAVLNGDLEKDQIQPYIGRNMGDIEYSRYSVTMAFGNSKMFLYEGTDGGGTIYHVLHYNSDSLQLEWPEINWLKTILIRRRRG